MLTLLCVGGVFAADVEVKVDVQVIGDNMKIGGFDFKNANFSTAINAKAEKIKTDYNHIPNQVVLGHSQGGLTALGYIKKEKALAVSQNRPSNVKAFISVDSPQVGFAGLDYGYDTLRARVLNAAAVHTNAVGSSLAVIPVVGLLGDAYNSLPTTWQLNLIMIFLKDMPMHTLIDTVINKSSAAAGTTIQEITDMGRASAYVKANVGYDTVTKVKYQSGTRSYLAVEWRTGLWGIKYAVIVTRTEPVYSYYDRIDHIATFRNDIPIGHVVGTDNDPLRMTGDFESKARFIKDCVAVGYGVAGAANTVMAVVTFPFGTNYYAFNAANCFIGLDWTLNYVSKWGDIIGGQANDSFITQGSQVLPGTPGRFVVPIKVDHNRSTNDPRIWDGPNCKVNILKGLMEVGQQ